MDRTTHQYPFESLVNAAVFKLAHSTFGPPEDGDPEFPTYWVEVGQDFCISRTSSSKTGSSTDTESRAQEKFIAFCPIEDGMEYLSLEWKNVDRELMEKFVQQKFTAADFVSKKDGAVIAYPSSWCVWF